MIIVKHRILVSMALKIFVRFWFCMSGSSTRSAQPASLVLPSLLCTGVSVFQQSCTSTFMLGWTDVSVKHHLNPSTLLLSAKYHRTKVTVSDRDGYMEENVGLQCFERPPTNHKPFLLNGFCKPLHTQVKSKWQVGNGWTCHLDYSCMSHGLQNPLKGNVFPLIGFCKPHCAWVKSKLVKAT